MSRLRKTFNAGVLTVYTIRVILYRLTRIVGSRVMIVPMLVIALYLIGHARTNEDGHAVVAVATGMFIVWLGCKLTYPRLRPEGPPRLAPMPPPPPPPPPRATASAGRADDPDEATVIGRLDPKLRDLLDRRGTTGRGS